MSSNFYVYIYLNPLKNYEPFYIGFGKNNRMKDHLKKSSDKNRHKFYTIQKIRRETGNDPTIRIFQSNLTSNEAIEIERGLIWAFGRADLGQGPLTNLTAGGEGTTNLTQESAVKKKNSLTGRKLSEDHIEKIRKNMIGRIPWNKGVPQSSEQKEKHSRKMRGKPSWNKGISPSDETRLKMKRPKSDEHKLKLSKARMGKPPWNKGKNYKRKSSEIDVTLL